MKLAITIHPLQFKKVNKFILNYKGFLELLLLMRITFALLQRVIWTL